MGPSQTPPTSYPPRQAPPARPRPLSLDACVSSQPFSPPPPQQYTWQPFESPQPMDVRHIPASANLWYPPTVEPVTYPPLPPTSQPSSLPYVDVAGGLGNTPQEGNFSRAPPVSLEPWATIQPFFSPPWESPISAPIFSTDSGSNSAPASFRQQTDVVHRPSIPHRHPDTA